MREGRILTPTDLFPPEGHRYLTDDQLQALRDQAVSGDDMTLPGLTVLELICDIRNAEQELRRAKGGVTRRHLAEGVDVMTTETTRSTAPPSWVAMAKCLHEASRREHLRRLIRQLLPQEIEELIAQLETRGTALEGARWRVT